MPRQPRTEAERRRDAAQARGRRLSRRLAEHVLPTLQPGDRIPTDREMLILAETFIHGGQEPAAACLGIAEHTVKNTCSHLYAKLGVTSNVLAAVALGWMAFPLGLVPPHRKPLTELEPAPTVVRYP